MASYYEGKEFYNIKYATDIVLENHFKNLLFPDELDLNKIIYSSNAYAFRKRATNKDTTIDVNNLDLPFINYRMTDYDNAIENRPTWFHNRGNADGIYIPELQEKIRFTPIRFEYESSFWCHRDDEMMYAIHELRWDSDNQTLLTTPITINTEIFNFPTHLGYMGLKAEPEYNEQDWLERNKIHSISMDFEVHTWHIRRNPGSDTTWQIAEELIFDFVAQHGGENTTSFEENLQFVINHLTEEVELW